MSTDGKGSKTRDISPGTRRRRYFEYGHVQEWSPLVRSGARVLYKEKEASLTVIVKPSYNLYYVGDAMVSLNELAFHKPLSPAKDPSDGLFYTSTKYGDFLQQLGFTKSTNVNLSDDDLELCRGNGALIRNLSNNLKKHNVIYKRVNNTITGIVMFDVVEGTPPMILSKVTCGRIRGTGRELWGYMFKFARLIAAKKIGLDAIESSVPIWEKLGFKNTHTSNLNYTTYMERAIRRSPSSPVGAPSR